MNPFLLKRCNPFGGSLTDGEFATCASSTRASYAVLRIAALPLSEVKCKRVVAMGAAGPAAVRAVLSERSSQA
jgi:hypothetical protein